MLIFFWVKWSSHPLLRVEKWTGMEKVGAPRNAFFSFFFVCVAHTCEPLHHRSITIFGVIHTTNESIKPPKRERTKTENEVLVPRRKKSSETFFFTWHTRIEQHTARRWGWALPPERRTNQRVESVAEKNDQKTILYADKMPLSVHVRLTSFLVE